MARRSKNGNQGMHDTKMCYAPGCKLYDARKWSCCSIPYCVVHQEAKYHTHADIHAIKFADSGWMPGQPVVLGEFEGMPVKKAIRARKAAAKAARKALQRRKYQIISGLLRRRSDSSYFRAEGTSARSRPRRRDARPA